ncbi:TonB family protein [Steroidobacter sp. S1-65]|uniref:TonB family protein n=1 Tax=Steroidobacter gossypii TaxID=2805490 RepID=A0ABS1WQH2_9GAMM|nr:TonB family protein [Steroidobacter gossypii]MBM0103227.1 TonB family protein [Steroidobacter gossypii]
MTATVSTAETNAPKLVRLHVEAPEYPANARRFNLSGTVIAKMRVEMDGHVSKTEIIQSPADILSDAVVQTTAKWRYQPIAEPTEAVVQIPFQLSETDEGYAFSTASRSLAAPVPSSAAELGVNLTEGWSHIRLLIDGSGAIQGTLLLKSSGDDFDASCKAILSALKFTPAPPGLHGYKTTTVNLFFIRVLEDGEIRVTQLPGT